MRNFLIPVDFSYCSRIVFDHALSLCTAAHANIVLMHVQDQSLFYSFTHAGGYHNAESYESGIEALEAWAREGNSFLENKGSDLVVEAISLEGDPVDVIIDQILKSNYDLVLLGVKHGGKIRQLLGSLNFPILDKTKTPVLFIPEIEGLTIPKEIIFTTDFNEFDLECLKNIYRIFGPAGIPIKLLHYSRDEEVLTDKRLLNIFVEQLHSSFPYQEVTTKVISHSESEELLDALLDIDHGWLSMSTHTRSFFEKITNPSLSKRVITSSERPVLVFKKENQTVESNHL